MQKGSLDPEVILDRHVERNIRRALVDSRIVALVGPRQAGKTTLVRRIAESEQRPFVTLDDAHVREFAQDDPIGFVRGYDNLVIDEIQRAPDLILELKRMVDLNPDPGQFLITGSVDLFRSSLSPDSLAGRAESVTLLPLSQSEIASVNSNRLPRSCIWWWVGYQSSDRVHE